MILASLMPTAKNNSNNNQNPSATNNNNDNNNKIQININQIIKNTYKTVPIGTSPLQQLQLKYSSQSDCNQLKYILTKILQYPSQDLAKIHRDSNRLGTLDLHQNSQILTKINLFDEEETSFVHCTCCGFILQKQQLSVTQKFIGIDNLGVSTFLYFQTLKSLVLMLLAQLLIYSIYSLTTNVISSNTITSAQQISSNLNFLVISLSSKQLNQTKQNEIYYLIQCWLGLVTVIIWCFMLIAIKYYQRNYQVMIQRQTLSAADYSIMISNVPNKLTKQQLQQHLTKYYNKLQQNNKIRQKIQNQFHIQKFNMVIPFDLNQQKYKDEELTKLQQKKQKIKQYFISWIIYRSKNDNFPLSSLRQRIKYYKKYQKLLKRINYKNKKLLENIYQQLSKSKINSSKSINGQKQQQKNTTVFVTLQSNHAKQLICRLNDNSYINKFRQFILCKSDQKLEFNYHSEQQQQIMNNLHQKQSAIQPEITFAPQPQDIIWTNLGKNNFEMLLRKMFTYTITLIMLGGSFGIIYLLSIQQLKNSTSSYITFLISIAISVINVIIQRVIYMLTSVERQSTQTKHQTSLAIKSVFAQLVNSVVTPFVVNYFIEDRNLYNVNGLAYDLFLLGVTNAFLMPLLKIFDAYYLFTRILAWWYSKPLNKLKISQQQLNAKYQLIPFQVGYQYIYLVNLYLFVCFFVSLQPILCVFALCGYLMMYWAQKYSLLNRMKRPFPGNDFVNTTMYQLIYLGPLCFSLGNLTWSNLLSDGFPQTALIPNLISIGFSILILFLPYRAVSIIFFSSQLPPLLTFKQNRVYLPSEYDRLNPYTSKQSIKQYIQYINQLRNNLKSNTQQQLLKLHQLFYKQSQQGKPKSDKNNVTNNLLQLLNKNYSKIQQQKNNFNSKQIEQQYQQQQQSSQNFMDTLNIDINNLNNIIQQQQSRQSQGKQRQIEQLYGYFNSNIFKDDNKKQSTNPVYNLMKQLDVSNHNVITFIQNYQITTTAVNLKNNKNNKFNNTDTDLLPSSTSQNNTELTYNLLNKLLLKTKNDIKNSKEHAHQISLNKINNKQIMAPSLLYNLNDLSKNRNAQMDQNIGVVKVSSKKNNKQQQQIKQQQNNGGKYQTQLVNRNDDYNQMKKRRKKKDHQ